MRTRKALWRAHSDVYIVYIRSTHMCDKHSRMNGRNVRVSYVPQNVHTGAHTYRFCLLHITHTRAQGGLCACAAARNVCDCVSGAQFVVASSSSYRTGYTYIHMYCTHCVYFSLLRVITKRARAPTKDGRRQHGHQPTITHNSESNDKYSHAYVVQ